MIDTAPSDNSLLKPHEPGPYRVKNADSDRPILLVCDHASCRFPEALGDMGLDPFARRCHLAIDIGAAAVTERLSDSLNATAVLCNYSRLVVDCNRELLDSGAFLQFGDGIIVPGNGNLHMREKEQRAEAIYWPYHREIDAQIDRIQGLGMMPFFVSIHSFTPVLNGEYRPWEMGVLWDADEPSARILIDELRALGYTVGDNVPYSGKAPQDYTVDNHAEARGLPHIALEVRQDIISHSPGQDRVARQLHRIIGSIPQKLGLKVQRASA